jgi:hypothetical protein
MIGELGRGCPSARARRGAAATAAPRSNRAAGAACAQSQTPTSRRPCGVVGRAVVYDQCPIAPRAPRTIIVGMTERLLR